MNISDKDHSSIKAIIEELKKAEQMHRSQYERLQHILDKSYDADVAQSAVREMPALTPKEVEMICNQIDAMVINAVEIKHIIEMTHRAPAWVESKIAVCASKIGSIRNYLIGKNIDVK